MKITTEQLIQFFAARSPGFAGDLASDELPAANESFAPMPFRGNLHLVRTEPDADWPSNTYSVFSVPTDSKGAVVERISATGTHWRFVGVGGDQWRVDSPEEWRVKNAFEVGDGIANSQFGPYTPDNPE